MLEERTTAQITMVLQTKVHPEQIELFFVWENQDFSLATVP